MASNGKLKWIPILPHLETVTQLSPQQRFSSEERSDLAWLPQGLMTVLFLKHQKIEDTSYCNCKITIHLLYVTLKEIFKIPPKNL